MNWISLRVETSSATDREAAMAALFAAGAQGVHEDGLALVTHFPPDVDVQVAVNAVEAVAPQAQFVVGETPQIDWSVAWREKIVAQRVGRFVVCPPWLAEEYSAEERIVIDPGMAFGTGDHASTRGALRLLQNEVRPGIVVADLGAGSAVLSIAAAKLGAVRAYGIEYDGDAIPNAEENVLANGVDDIVEMFEGDATVLLPLVAPVDLIVANIISSVLVDLSSIMHASLAPGARAVLAGILVEERGEVLDTFLATGWSLVDEYSEEGWWSATLERR